MAASQRAHSYNLAALSLNNQVGAMASLIVLMQDSRTVLAKVGTGSYLSFFFKEKFDPALFEGTPFPHPTLFGDLPCIRSEFLGTLFRPSLTLPLLLCEGGSKSSLFPWIGYLGLDFLGDQFSLLYSKGEVNLNLPPSWENFDLAGLSRLPRGRMGILVQLSEQAFLAAVDTRASLSLVDTDVVQSSPQDFRKLPMTVEAVDGLGNPVIIEIYEAREIRVQNILLQKFKVAVTDLKKLLGAETSERVVLGGNFITRFDWFFDLKNHRYGISNPSL
jgi:hypothetical protein